MKKHVTAIKQEYGSTVAVCICGWEGTTFLGNGEAGKVDAQAEATKHKVEHGE